jgi:drug/metabolite transporter (DMT)-like permease
MPPNVRPIATATPRLPDETVGMLLGLIGVAIFSLTLPFTRMAVAELHPLFVSMGRAVIAAVLAGIWLSWKRASLPKRSELPALAAVAGGCVIGFPLLTSIAMQSLPASHGAVLVGILPLATALFSSRHGQEKPSAGFWAVAALGTALVIGFALRQNSGSLHPADLAILAAGLMASFGYAEGARLSRTLGGEQTISWALLLSLPVVLPLAAMSVYDKLTELNITLAKPPAAPAAAYVMYVQTGNLVFISGHIAKNADGSVNVGQLGKDKTTADGQAAARASRST